MHSGLQTSTAMLSLSSTSAASGARPVSGSHDSLNAWTEEEEAVLNAELRFRTVSFGLSVLRLRPPRPLPWPFPIPLLLPRPLPILPGALPTFILLARPLPNRPLPRPLPAPRTRPVDVEGHVSWRRTETVQEAGSTGEVGWYTKAEARLCALPAFPWTSAWTCELLVSQWKGMSRRSFFTASQ